MSTLVHTPAELLVIQRAAAGRSLDEIALDATLDDAAYIRAYGGRDPRWLDQALRIKRAEAVRVLEAYGAAARAAGRKA